MRKLFLFLITILACTWNLSAQQTKTIHGTVLDAANNEPLIGATVMPIGGGQGAAADLDGKFTLTVPSNVTKANVTYVGYKGQTVTLQNNMTIHLSSSSSDLDEVIVVAYGTANKESLTGSVAVVGAKEIEDRPVTSVTAALEGNAPGVQVNNTVGSPGTDPDIRIRGFNSFSGSANKPIYVVDGMPFNGGINDLNPNDIESMTVLKDAASAALYGNKGANGVILITTKKAKSQGKVDVGLSIGLGMYNRGLPQYSRLGADDWMGMVFNGAYNRRVTLGSTPDEAREYVLNNFFDMGVAGYNVYGDAEGNGQIPSNLLFTPEGKIAPGYSVLPGYKDDLDWWKAVSRNGFRQEYNINASAATEKFNIFSSVSYLKEKGYLLRTDFERYTARMNANFTPTSYFKFGVNLSGTAQSSEQNGNTGSDTNTANPFGTDYYGPIYPYYKHDPLTGEIIPGYDGKPQWSNDTYTQNSNIAYVLRNDYQNYTYYMVEGTLYGTAIIPYGFELTVRGNMSKSKTAWNLYQNNKIGAGVAPNGTLLQEFDDNVYSTFMQTLTWNHDYGRHHVDVLLDHENWRYSSKYTAGQKNDQSIDGIYDMGNFNTLIDLSGVGVQIRTESYLGRVRYDFGQQYFGELSIRRDGSSKFAKKNRWGTFWSAGLSWVISKENFMRELTWVNFLKLRAAYGAVGNDAAAGEYAYWPLYGINTYWGSTALLKGGLVADDLKWESTKTFDIGLDGSLFDDRLSFSIGYFDKRNADLIFNVTKAASVGCPGTTASNPSVATNIGTMSNRGWELSFDVDIIRNPEFQWTAHVDGSFVKNKIISLPNGEDIVGGLQRQSEGKSIYEFFTYTYAGVDQMNGRALYVLDPNSYDIQYGNTPEQAQALYESRLNRAKEAGQYAFSRDGVDYVYDNSYASKSWKGTALPTVYGSFGTNLSWKGINLGLLFTYGLGGQTYDSNYMSLMSPEITSRLASSAMHEDMLNSWTSIPEGMTEDSPNRIDPNGIPQYNFANVSMSNGASDRWLTSASYLVFKNLNISYSLPQKWVAPLQLQNINVGFAVDNLFTVAARKGMNPQASWSGGQAYTFGTARVFSFNINAKF